MAGTGRNCLDSDPIWTRLVVLILLPTVLLSVPPVVAHTNDELEAWRVAWGWRAIAGDSGKVQQEYENMTTRHPSYFGRRVSHGHAPVAGSRQSTWAESAEQWRPLVAAYFRAADVDRALRIMACESGGDPDAKHPRSSASGLFQHLGKYWTARSQRAGFAGADIFDPTANVAVAAWLRDQPGGWRHWICR